MTRDPIVIAAGLPAHLGARVFRLYERIARCAELGCYSCSCCQYARRTIEKILDSYEMQAVREPGDVG